VSTVDLAPTILAACGLEPVAAMQGLNLLDAAAGKGPLKRDAVFGDLYEHTAVDVDEPSLNLTHRWVRQGQWKLIVPVKREPELYNVKEDPHEEKNLAAERKDLVEQLKRRLDAWWDVKT
jgi:arylsulfatase A-like enzyme